MKKPHAGEDIDLLMEVTSTSAHTDCCTRLLNIACCAPPQALIKGPELSFSDHIQRATKLSRRLCTSVDGQEQLYENDPRSLDMFDRLCSHQQQLSHKNKQLLLALQVGLEP